MLECNPLSCLESAGTWKAVVRNDVHNFAKYYRNLSTSMNHMLARAPSNVLTILAILATLANGCSVWDQMDVCWNDRTDQHKRPQEVLVNHKTDGLQKVSSAWAAGALPNGDALLVYESEVPGQGLMKHRELRLARVSNAS